MLPVIYFNMDTMKLNLERRNFLDGSYCLPITTPTECLQSSKISRLVIAWLNLVAEDSAGPVTQLHHDRPGINLYKIREESDPFPGTCHLDPVNSNQRSGVEASITRMIPNTFNGGFLEYRLD